MPVFPRNVLYLPNFLSVFLSYSLGYKSRKIKNKKDCIVRGVKPHCNGVSIKVIESY